MSERGLAPGVLFAWHGGSRWDPLGVDGPRCLGGDGFVGYCNATIPEVCA